MQSQQCVVGGALHCDLVLVSVPGAAEERDEGALGIPCNVLKQHPTEAPQLAYKSAHIDEGGEMDAPEIHLHVRRIGRR